MTNPPAPPPAPPAPAPPAPSPPPPAPAPPAPAPGPDDELAKLRASLEEERRQRREAEGKLGKLEQQHMTDQEKAIAQAKEEGRAEAAQAASLRLAAAEFRAQAAGKIANPDAALAVLDLSKLLKDGEPDKTAIGKLVDQLAAVPPPPGKVPAGPRDPGNGLATDWLGDQARAAHGLT
jgi:hypothetical protein